MPLIRLTCYDRHGPSADGVGTLWRPVSRVLGHATHETTVAALPTRDNDERFLLTGAAPNMGAQRVSFARRTAKQKTLIIM